MYCVYVCMYRVGRAAVGSCDSEGAALSGGISEERIGGGEEP